RSCIAASLAAAMAPWTTTAGAWSPPIASTAMRMACPGTAGGSDLVADRAHLTAAVVPAGRADHVRRLQLGALRARAERGGLEGIVRPALGRTALGMASLGIRHDRVFSRRTGRAPGPSTRRIGDPPTWCRRCRWTR